MFCSFGWGPSRDQSHPNIILPILKVPEPQQKDHVRVLSWNIQMLPKCVSGETYPCKFWEQRLADMFTNGNLDQFDILTLQECFGGMPGCVKQLIFSYAQRVGFVYIAQSSDPQFWHSFNVCGGAAILSRYPITKKDEYIFRNSVYSDSESSLGVIYAEIEIDLSKIS